MEQGRDSQTGRRHEEIERDAYARFDRLAEGIVLSDTDQARVDQALRYDFTRENGATRVVPGSHRSVEPVDQDAGVVDAEMPAGSLLVWDGAVWHGSGENRTRDRFRTSINLNFNLSWLRQQENQYLGIPGEVLARLPELLQRLLGYNRSLFGGVSRTSSLDYFTKHYG